VGKLQQRVESLEDGATGPCAVCAHDADALVAYKIVWETDEDAPSESSPPCPRCGNQSTVVVDWQDERSERHSHEHDTEDDDDPFDDHDADPVVTPDAREGAAAQVPDYPPRWNDSEARGGVDGY
jgi:hypothetical protein